MTTEKIGLTESIAMAVGGMVGGGIFAVLGVVATSAGTLAWAAFVVAGTIALAAGYSFVRLGRLADEGDGPITYVERFTGSTKLAGMTGWTFVVGYVGTMAMYAYAFGGYFVGLVGVSSIVGLPARQLVSFVVVAAFVGLNTLGAHASGRTEDVLVGLKVLILLGFGFGGLYYGLRRGEIRSGVSAFGVGPVVAAALSFVAFEGWELLLFDRDSIRNPARTVRIAIYVSIVFVTGLYVVVAVVTTNLVSASVIQRHSETALAIAARPFLGQLGFVLISVAALFSTGSAINATLFSSSRLLSKMATEDFLPAQLGSGSDDGSEGDGGDENGSSENCSRGSDDSGSGDDGNGRSEPVRALVVLGALTAGFTVLGSLDGISSFASLSFITIFGGASYLAFRKRGDSLVTNVVPFVGVVGAAATIFALLWHLYTDQRSVFWTVTVIAAVVVGSELLYFEREPISSEVSVVEEEVEERL